jgi:hypothetical protein
MSQGTNLALPAVEDTTGSFNSDAPQAADAGHVDQVIAQIEDELRLLTLERVAIGSRIAIIKYTLIGLVNIFGSDIINEELRALIFRTPNVYTTADQPGFTEICRQILRHTARPLTLHQLWDKMRNTYPSVLARHRHPTTSFAVVLRRLQIAGEVEVFNKNSVRTWQWAARPRNTADDTSSSLPIPQPNQLQSARQQTRKHKGE